MAEGPGGSRNVRPWIGLKIGTLHIQGYMSWTRVRMNTKISPPQPLHPQPAWDPTLLP